MSKKVQEKALEEIEKVLKKYNCYLDVQQQQVIRILPLPEEVKTDTN